MPYVVAGKGSLPEQGFKPKGRAGARNRTEVCQVAWKTAMRDNKNVKVVPCAYGYALVVDEKREAIPMGHPYFEVTPEGFVTAYKWEL